LIHLFLQGLLRLLGLCLLFGLLLRCQRPGLIAGLILAGVILARLILCLRWIILAALVGRLAGILLRLLILLGLPALLSLPCPSDEDLSLSPF
jgi:hypothetical protein